MSFGRDFTVLAMCIGNVQVNWPKLFQDFSVKFTLIFSCMRSFNHSTSAHVKNMHIYPIDAKLRLLEHFEKLVKLIIIQVIPQSRRNRTTPLRTLVIRFISTFIYCDQYCTATIYSATCSARGTHIVYVFPNKQSNNQSIKPPLRFVILSRSKCSKSHKFASMHDFFYMC